MPFEYGEICPLRRFRLKWMPGFQQSIKSPIVTIPRFEFQGFTLAATSAGHTFNLNLSFLTCRLT